MHIKLVVKSFPTASTTFLFNLVTGLESRGVQVTVCATSKTKDLHLYTHRLNEWSGRIEHISIKPGFFSELIHLVLLIFSNPALLVKTLKNKGVKRGWRYFVTIH